MLVLLIALPLPCRATGFPDSVAAALAVAQTHLLAPLDRIGLPGLGRSRSPVPGGSLTRGTLAAATRIVSGESEKLFAAATVDDFLELTTGDSLPVILSQSPGPRLAQADALEKYLPGFRAVLALLTGANRELRRAFAPLSFAERAELRGLVRDFEFWRDQWPDYPLKRMLALAERVDRKHLSNAGRLLALCAATIRDSVSLSATSRDKPLTFQTPWGAVVLGTPGHDIYRERALLIVDPGGGDSYRLPDARWPAVQMIIDLGGDDSYRSEGGFALGGALMGASWLEDVSGDDSYWSGPFSQGCGALGVGVLVDRRGDDSYRGGYLCQGASFFGTGALIDMEGDDSYDADFGAQGASFAAGSALLADLAGDDRYHAGGRFRSWRSPGATKSFAQGCAAGIRPFIPGGRAVLFDRSGEDSLSISYMGQGAGYWGGYGLLLSGGGDDSYRAERYAQGCGLHFATGALVELGGNDSYALEGVGQGAGEDRAWGFLLEAAGDDIYNSARMARGAGGTGGVGLLLELAGGDVYPAAGQVTGGAGSRTWELPGMGFMLDMRGHDSYGDGYEDGQISKNGPWGARLDFLQGN